MKKLNLLIIIIICVVVNSSSIYSITIINNSKEKIVIGFNGAKVGTKKNFCETPFQFWIYSDSFSSINAKQAEAEFGSITEWPNEIFIGFSRITLSENMTRDEFDNSKNTLTILEDDKMILEIDNNWHLSVTD